MKPLFVVAVCLLAVANAAPDELPKEKGTITEVEESDPQTRKERCTTCPGGFSLGFKSPNAVLAQIQAIPGTEIHTQQSFESCTSDKGCAGLKVKDGRVVEKFGNVDAFKAAAAADSGNEFTFHAAGNLGNVFEGGVPNGGPYWWMNENSPFKAAAGNAGGAGFEKFSKSSSSFTSSGNAAGAGGAANGAGFSATLDLSGNPFLNGEFSKIGGSFAGGQEVKPATFQSSSFESSSFSTSNDGNVDLSKNPYLNGAGFNKAGSGYQAQGGFTSGGAGYNSAAGQNFGANSQSSQSSFAAGGKFGSGYTGSSPSPFTASTGSGANVNLIQTSQKANEFDFESQQQTQQNIDEIFQGTGNVHAHEHSGGELTQTCAGQGYVCVHKAQCNNGVVNTNGAGLLQAKTKKQYCNTKTEICCRIEISTLNGAGGLQGSLGVGSATFQGGSSQGSGLFVSGSQGSQGSQGSAFGAGQSGSAFGQNGQSGSAFGQAGQSGSAFGQSGQSGSTFNTASQSESSFGSSQNGFGQAGQAGQAGQGQGGFQGNAGQGAQGSFGSTTSNFGSSSSFGSKGTGSGSGSQGGFGAQGTFNNGAAGNNFGAGNRGVTVESSSSSFESRGTSSGFGAGAGNKGTGAAGFGASGTFNGAGFGSTLAPGGNGGSSVYKTSQTSFTETDSFSAGSETQGVYRPGASGLKPGIPYLPPVPSTPFPTTPRPFTTPKPTYLPPVSSTTAPGYLPPDQNIASESRVPSPTYNDGSLILDETRQPPRKPVVPLANEIPSGCAAALKCTPIEFCTAEGVISNTTVVLTRDQDAYRVPLTDCKDLETGRVGKCCRDPYYTDPWPTNQLGKWVQGVFGGNDGKYTPDSRGSPSISRPQITVRPPVSGGALLNNFRTPKPTLPPFGPNQVTPGFPASTATQSSFGQKGQFEIRGQGQFGQGAQGQFAQGGQGQFTQGGQGQFAQGGQGQFAKGGQGQFGIGAQGAQGSQGSAFGQSQFSSSSNSFSSGSSILGANQAAQGQVGQGQGQIVTQGQGQFAQGGRGQYAQGGVGRVELQGGGAQGQFSQGSQTQKGFGQAVITGQGQSVSQGVGTGVRQGSGFSVSQGSGFNVENEYSESVQRVFLSQYNGGGQCGLLNGQKPYGNRNENEVDFAEIPWQAMVLLQTNKSLLCGGVITRPDVVLTSASCVDGLDARNVLIKGGEWKLGIDDEPLPFQIVQVKTIVRHPFYKRGSLHFDAAILVLSENLRFAKNIYPICLPRAGETLDAFYNGAGECIVTGWGKQVLQGTSYHGTACDKPVVFSRKGFPGETVDMVSSRCLLIAWINNQRIPVKIDKDISEAHLAGAIMHSLNVSLINPGECQAKLQTDYPHLLEQYDQESCACGQPTNPVNNICRVDIGSALACTTDSQHFVLRGVYSWDSGCQLGNQLAAFYKFDLEWYEWAIGLIESVRFAQFSSGAQVQSQNQFSGQIKGGQQFGIKGAGAKGQFAQGQVGGFGGGFAQGFSQFSSSSSSQSSNERFGEVKGPIANSFSASFSEKKVFQSEPKIVTFTTKPEIVTFTTKPEFFTFTTKPKIVTYTTKPQIINYETSGSVTNPQYVAPGVTFNPSFKDVVGAHSHTANCKCLEGKK